MLRLKGSIEFFEPSSADECIYKIKREVLNKAGDEYSGNIRVEVNPFLKNEFSVKRVLGVYPDSQMYEKGVSLSIFRGVRKNPNIKEAKAELRIRIDDFLRENSSYEAVIVHDGKVFEGSRSNLFFIKGNSIITAKANDVLMGITRQKVIEMAIDMNLPLIERDINLEELDSFDSAFITGTSINILPINCIGDATYDTDNEVLKKMMDKNLFSY